MALPAEARKRTHKHTNTEHWPTFNHFDALAQRCIFASLCLGSKLISRCRRACACPLKNATVPDFRLEVTSEVTQTVQRGCVWGVDADFPFAYYRVNSPESPQVNWRHLHISRTRMLTRRRRLQKCFRIHSKALTSRMKNAFIVVVCQPRF